MPTPTAYDVIGDGYTKSRKPDPRIEAAIHAAFGDAKTLLNVGAGAGSYEPSSIDVVALEPSRMMIDQRVKGAAPAVQGNAEQLPFQDNAFDASLASLTVHHWRDATAGLLEMQRVTRGRVVIFTWEQSVCEQFWLLAYFPWIISYDRPRAMAIETVTSAFSNVKVEEILIPHDCTDGFLGAYWRRPEAYLEPAVRAAISSFAVMPDDVMSKGLRQLEADITSGKWAEDHRALTQRSTLDIGYRLIIAG